MALVPDPGAVERAIARRKKRREAQLRRFPWRLELTEPEQLWVAGWVIADSLLVLAELGEPMVSELGAGMFDAWCST